VPIAKLLILLAFLVRDQEVGGSNPLAPTNFLSLAYTFKPFRKTGRAFKSDEKAIGSRKARSQHGLRVVSFVCSIELLSCNQVRAPRLIDPPGEDQGVAPETLLLRTRKSREGSHL
jgi:hypothetical protein